ncbi:unnamed protein product [Coffea canephora]|uniref:Uncharacterized protein n=1 Tax=Coffea canephora TaxID=49390 RepID=A0A068UTT6_COFCA|nr:unnamed protein product [Coffea canephora]
MAALLGAFRSMARNSADKLFNNPDIVVAVVGGGAGLFLGHFVAAPVFKKLYGLDRVENFVLTQKEFEAKEKVRSLQDAFKIERELYWQKIAELSCQLDSLEEKKRLKGSWRSWKFSVMKAGIDTMTSANGIHLIVLTVARN